VEVVCGGRGVEAVGGLRLGVAGVAACVVVAACGWLAAGRALAAGDANEAGCPAATESSPGFRAGLPDCRAYELVSEPNSGDLLNIAGTYGFPEGEHVTYMSGLPTASPETANSKVEHFVATRRSGGWEQRAVSLPEGEGPVQHIQTNVNFHDEEVAFTSDFSKAFAMTPFHVRGEEPTLNETSSATVNVLVYGLPLTGGPASLQSAPDSGPLTQEMVETPSCKAAASEEFKVACGAQLAGASSDGSKVFFVTSMKLATAAGTPADTSEFANEIYERAGGHTYLVSVLPDGSVPKCGAEVGEGVIQPEDYSYGAVAPSGANVVFTASDCVTSGLYLRDLLDGRTVQLPGGSSSRYVGRAGTGPGEEEVVFTAGEGKFYAYHLTSGQTTEFGEGAIGLLAWSADGSRIYYLGPREEIDVWHNGETQPILGTEIGGYRFSNSKKVREGGWIPGSAVENMPVASGGGSEGSHLLFIDRAQLTSYKNEGHMEAYLYDAHTGNVTCISCNPTGLTPLEQELEPEQGNAQLIGPETPDTAELNFLGSSSPLVSEDGTRAVFETTEALVPQDVNGVDDVYEWEQLDTGGCTRSSATFSEVNDGCLYMLSPGVGGETGTPEATNNADIPGTHLASASNNLGDIYLQSDEPLLPGLDNAAHLYDVRVDGGFPYTPASHGCEPGQCKAATESPLFSEPASIAFSGAGNLKPHTAAHRHKLTRAQRLRRALRACRKRRSKRRRVACERAAHRKYAVRADFGGRHGAQGSSR
jgi:hypothetical protein